MRKNRPINLNLFAIRFPVTAIISILHRISGVILFLFIVLLLYALELSLQSPASFSSLQQFFQNGFIKFLIWGFLSSLIFHVFAGIRHLIMDLGWGEEKHVAKISSWLVILLVLITSIGLGIRIW